nr:MULTISPECIES: lipopolysaccharide biosynthesis protein [Gammaproteobacteria]
MELSQNVIKGLKVGAMLRLVAQIFTWLNTLILIRLLTPEDYGLMAMTMAFIGIFALMGDFGIGKAIIQAEELTTKRLRQAFTINIVSCLVFFSIFFLIAPVIASFFDEPRVTILVQAVACQHLIMIFHTLPYAMASRKMLFKEREKVQFYTTLMTSIVTIAMAASGLGVWSLILGHLFMRLALTVGYNFIAPCWVRPALSFKGFSKMAGFSGVATINDVLRFFINIFGSISIGRLLTKAELGVFSVTINLANLPSEKIGELLNHLGLSSFAKLQNERAVAGQYLHKSVQLASLVLFPMYLGICAISPELITLVLSDKWAAAIVPFQILCLTSPFRMLSEMMATGITAIGEPGKNSKTLLLTILTLPAFFYGIQYGVAGACWAWLGINLISFAFHLKLILPVFELKPSSLLSALLPSLSSSIIMLVGLLLLRDQLTGQVHEAAQMFLMILAGVLLFSATQLLLFRRQLFTTINYLRH